jgi:hypothetical protein
MKQMHRDDVHALGIGKLVSNLGTLETGLRVVIYLSETPPRQRLPDSFRIAELADGQILEETALTSWDSLGELISHYNNLHPDAAIDEDFKRLRDALAHGRIVASGAKSEMRLVRFAKPRNGKVAVEMAQTLSLNWLDEQIKRTMEANRIVNERLHEVAQRA